MGRVKTKTEVAKEPYIPKLDTQLYVYILKKPLLLTPVPYKNKTNYQYILPLIKK
jgi:hypothetical protein